MCVIASDPLGLASNTSTQRGSSRSSASIPCCARRSWQPTPKSFQFHGECSRLRTKELPCTAILERRVALLCTAVCGSCSDALLCATRMTQPYLAQRSLGEQSYPVHSSVARLLALQPLGDVPAIVLQHAHLPATATRRHLSTAPHPRRTALAAALSSAYR